MAAGFEVAAAQSSPPSYFSLSAEYAPALSYGFSAEWRAPQGYILQAETFSRRENGPFLIGDKEVDPLERYRVYTVNAGGSTGAGYLEVGALVGGGYARGLMHGKLIESDPGGCDLACTGSYSRYDSLNLDGPITVLTFFAGFSGDNVALRLAPHIYFAHGRTSVAVPLVLQIRFR